MTVCPPAPREFKNDEISTFERSCPVASTPRRSQETSGSGRIPAVIYGRQIQPQNLEISAKELEDLIHHSASENLLVDLAVKDDARPKRLALVKEVQHHPLSGEGAPCGFP